MMKINVPHHRLIRLLSLFTVLVTCAVSVLRYSLRIEPCCVLCSALCGAAVLLCYPGSHSSVKPHLRCSCVMCAVCIVLAAFVRRPSVMVLLLSVVVLCSQIWMCVRRYSDVRALFSASAVWHGIEDNTGMFCISVFYVLVSFSVLLLESPMASGWFVPCAVSAYYVALYIRAYTGWYVFLSREKEKSVRQMSKGDFHAVVPPLSETENAKMSALFERVTKCMEEKKPYLNPEFSMADLQRMIFCNRVYVSRAINTTTGRNFRQFVNCYRVNYAEELMKKDPHLLVKEIAEMSGFSTVASFNLAFKLFRGDTPGNYMKNLGF